MTVKREVIEGPQLHGADETLVYTITTTPWASSPSVVGTDAKIFSYNVDTHVYTDVTSTNMTGTLSASSDILTLPAINGLTAGVRYRVEVKFTASGNVYEPYFWIYAQR